MKKILKIILTEDGIYSLPRVTGFLMLIAFLSVTFYLVLNDKTWVHYDTFAVVCGGGGIGGASINKLTNSVYNTPRGEAGKPKEINKNDIRE